MDFTSIQLFSRIVENGGFFVSRLKSNANPLIVGTNQVRNCHGIDLNGKHLKDIELEKSDDIFDVNVEVSFDRRSYRGERKSDNKIFRLIATYNAEAEEHHFYLTNIAPDILNASEIAAVYAARWEVELIFKELKSRYALDQITTKSPYAIEALIWISILTLLISQKSIFHSAKAKSGCQNGSLYSIEMEQHLCPKFLTSFVRDNGSSWNRARFLYSIKCILK